MNPTFTSNSQNYNRFSYVLNNPLKYSDPSGYVALNPWYETMINGMRFFKEYPEMGETFKDKNDNLWKLKKDMKFSDENGNVFLRMIGDGMYVEIAKYQEYQEKLQHYNSQFENADFGFIAGAGVFRVEGEEQQVTRWLSEVTFVSTNLVSFVTGIGSSITHYGPDSDATKRIRQSSGIQNAINQFAKSNGKKKSYSYPYSPCISSIDAFSNTVASSIDAHVATEGSPVQLFVGSYDVQITPIGTNQIGIIVTNNTGLNSLLFHIPSTLGINVDYSRSGNFGFPFSTITQQFYWTQQIP